MRGADAPRPRTRRGASKIIGEALEGTLAGFLAGPDGREAEPGAEVPAALAAALMAALPVAAPDPPGLPSRTAPTTDRAAALQGRIRFLRGELMANEHGAADSLLQRALDATGLRAEGPGR